jgi:hypothetical protein
MCASGHDFDDRDADSDREGDRGRDGDRDS